MPGQTDRERRQELVEKLKSIGIEQEFEIVQMIEDIYFELSHDSKKKAFYRVKNALKNHSHHVDLEFYSQLPY